MDTLAYNLAPLPVSIDKNPSAELAARINSLADHCVKCGMCLPHCPTYTKSLNENESPRGRIALMQGFASGQLIDASSVAIHLDRCLACRACERVCPPGVKYGTLLDSTQALLIQTRKRSLISKLLHSLGLGLVYYPTWLRRVIALLRFYQYVGAQRLLRRSGLFKLAGLLKLTGLGRLDRMLPPLHRPAQLKTHYPTVHKRRGRVALFTGCMGTVLEQATLTAAIGILNRLGYDVFIPAEQRCCGALHLHNGEPHKTLALARKNLRTFDIENVDAVVFTASGCGAQLSEYAQLAWDNTEDRQSAKQLSHKVKDITQFLAEIDWPEDINIAPLEKRIALHTPCSLRNILQQTECIEKLLRKIPGATLVYPEDNDRCCGAAGSYMLSQPVMADSLRDDKLRAIGSLKPDILVTTNIGCALHLATGLREQDNQIEIQHPVTLLARQIQDI